MAEESPGGPGIVAYGSSYSTHVEGSTSIVLTKPTDTVSGNGLYAFIATDTDHAVTPPSEDWTLIETVSNSSHRSELFELIAGGSEPANYTFTVPGSDELSGVIVRLTATAGTLTVNDSATDDVDLPPTPVAPVTADQDDSMLLVFYGCDDPTIINSGPDGMTIIVEYDAADPTLGAWYLEVDIGTVSGLEVGNDGGNATSIACIIQAE